MKVVSLICGVAAESTNCLCICGRRTWGPSTLCLFLQRPTVIITIVWMSLQFKRSWLRSPRISQSSCNPGNRNTILFRAAIPVQLSIVVSTLQVSVAWGGKFFGLNTICPNRSRIPNFSQLSRIPVDYKKRYPRLRQDFKILKMTFSAVVAVRLDCGGPSGMGRSLPSTPDPKPVGGPLG